MLAAGAASAAPPRPLVTGVMTGGTDEVVYRRVGEAGASVVRLFLTWRDVAPATRPASFDAADPADPAYRWDDYDTAIRHATANGLEPLVSIFSAPAWAERGRSAFAGTMRPEPKELAAFARAAARRYSGRFQGLPRVRYWQVWNEPNISLQLSPQFVNRRAVAPETYRALVNEMARAVRAVDRTNLVVAGGQSPFTVAHESVVSTGPMRFMRQLLCMGRDLRRLRRCPAKVSFDVWSHHPYTSGGPRHEASNADDVSLGDLPEMRALLRAAERAGRIDTRRSVAFWVTEFSWDTAPPDPKAVPARLHGRWVAEALHQMWQSGVTLATWFTLRDNPFPSSPYQSGLYFAGASLEADRPKPALAAFRFPFVAYRERGGVRVWGRTPAGSPGRVVVEQSFRGGWKRAAVLSTSRDGIVSKRISLATTPGDWLRARLASGGPWSLPFSLRPVADRYYYPFGT